MGNDLVKILLSESLWYMIAYEAKSRFFSPSELQKRLKKICVTCFARKFGHFFYTPVMNFFWKISARNFAAVMILDKRFLSCLTRTRHCIQYKIGLQYSTQLETVTFFGLQKRRNNFKNYKLTNRFWRGKFLSEERMIILVLHSHWSFFSQFKWVPLKAFEVEIQIEMRSKLMIIDCKMQSSSLFKCRIRLWRCQRCAKLKKYCILWENLDHMVWYLISIWYVIFLKRF